MNTKIKVAVLGCTGYVGLELIKILINHPNIEINFLGVSNILNIQNNDNSNLNINKNLPRLLSNDDFEPLNSDVVFLALPHGVSHNYVNKFFNKIKIIDLSADFRLDTIDEYIANYNNSHSCPSLLHEFIYGLPEFNKQKIKNANNIAVPGCYPTSILLPLIPLIKNNLINLENLIIDSKSGYSGAGKKFDISNIQNANDFNFYNYNTNEHRHICEIKQELNKFTKKKINFSFNPHILPVFRGMLSTIYCDVSENKNFIDIKNTLEFFTKDLKFLNFLKVNEKIELFKIQNTNNCLIKLYNYNNQKKIIIVSVIDNLIKGAAGQAIQCLNIIYNFDEELSLINY